MLGTELGRVVEPKHTGANRRRGGRLRAELLGCRMNGVRMGAVLDLSPQGMRLRSAMFVSVQRDAVFEVTLTCHRARVRLPARVAWVKRIGLTRREIGLHFLNVDPEAAAELMRMATLAKQFAYAAD